VTDEELYEDDNEETFATDGLDLADDKPLDDEELQYLGRRLVELRMVKDEAEKKAKDAKKEFETFQAEFYERIQKSPVKGSRNIDLGDDLGEVRLTPRATKYGRILDRDKAVAYLEERALDKEYLKDDFRMARVHELVRECIEQKKPIPPGFDFYTKEYFTITFKD
jgi:hypothetical protein